MSISVMSAVWQRSRATGSARLMLLTLADHAGADGRAWPSAARLARLTLLDVRNVQRALARLVAAGEIVRVGTGTRGVVIYEIRPGGASQPTTEAPYVERSVGIRPTAEAPYVARSDLRRVRRTTPAPYGAGVVPPTALPPEDPTAPAPDKPLLTVIEPSIEAAALQAAIAQWNRLADECGLVTVQRLTGSRAKKLAARLTDAGGLDGWAAALNMISRTPGLLGQGRDGGWRITFDWTISATNFTKILEGAYAGWDPRASGNGGGAQSRSGHATALAGLAEAARRVRRRRDGLA